MAELILPDHGGDMHWARNHFGGSEQDWLDLSTGISPWSWPVPALPEAVWQRLPSVDDASLRLAAAKFYGCRAENVLPVPGSQFAIARIPFALAPGSVAVPDPGYQEHAHAWRSSGHQLHYYHNQDELERLIQQGGVRSAVVINPNNPSAEVINQGRLLAWREVLEKRGGVLLVDEAFADARPEQSLASLAPTTNLVVLRSIGKFFGLAGLRLGFVLAPTDWLDRLRPLCDTWQISHPAQWVGQRALLDTSWQEAQLSRLASRASELQSVLQEAFPGATTNNGGLFVTLTDPSQSLYQTFLHCAKGQILLRYGKRRDGAEWLRVGLPRLAALERLAQRLVQG